jgi:2-polyprenyl-3-methyl-5-hydroxy-6-metoxy-1,4-benzoquinol methylase
MSTTLPQAAAVVEANRAWYDALTAGQDDYWRKMAAPRYRVQTITRLVQAAKPSSVVDLGCGNGVLLAELGSGLNVATCGIDLASNQIETNRRSSPHTRWESADLCAPNAIGADLEDSFDVVTASEVIEHVPDPREFLRNALRLARPGQGRLVLSTQSGKVQETERRVGHLQHFSIESMSALLADSGWQVERVWNTGYPFHDLSKWYANLNPDRSMAQFGNGAYGPVQNAVCATLRLAFRFNSQSRGAQLFATATRPAED